eukprot:7023974-Prymnesium_polylepis.1
MPDNPSIRHSRSPAIRQCPGQAFPTNSPCYYMYTRPHKSGNASGQSDKPDNRSGNPENPGKQPDNPTAIQLYQIAS